MYEYWFFPLEEVKGVEMRKWRRSRECLRLALSWRPEWMTCMNIGFSAASEDASVTKFESCLKEAALTCGHERSRTMIGIRIRYHIQADLLLRLSMIIL